MFMCNYNNNILHREMLALAKEKLLLFGSRVVHKRFMRYTSNAVI